MKGPDYLLDELSPRKAQGYWADRIISQLDFLRQMDKNQEGRHTPLITKALEYLEDYNEKEGAITKQAALHCEDMLKELQPLAKSVSLLCAAHAHIDMNWFWRYDETVSVTLDTMRTMLTLMDEFKEFKFSQSQASVYQIIEQYEPQMLERIKELIKEGRWEVTAAAWVEADKNMPSGESLARHILYTKRYLSKLLDIKPESLNVGFEPDTFGHSANVPEVLSNGGIKYYYHCRGKNGTNLYRWESPSGKRLLAYLDSSYYGGAIDTSCVMHLPAFAKDTGHNEMLYVYGVGDHGGGPTRRDISRIIDMNKWPLFPNIRCATYGEFFKNADKLENLPVVKGELNYIFTGCYSSQSRIKTANKISEQTLYDAEAFSAINTLQGGSPYPQSGYEDSWRKVLFSQFHDIVTGSCSIETREYTMGKFQEILAQANTCKTAALRQIAARIDTSAYIEEDESAVNTWSAGAGVGSGVNDFKVSQVCRGSGKTRIYTVFNPSMVEREENVELEVWNWDWDLKRLRFTDGKGNIVPHQLLTDVQTSWGYQKMFKVLISAKVPACGYNTYIMTLHNDNAPPISYMPYDRTDNVPDYVLENEHIKVAFDPRTAAIVSFIDKETGKDLVDKNRPAGIFRYIEENTTLDMTAWRVGPYMNVRNINENIVINKYIHGEGVLRQCIEFVAEFENSKLKVCVCLDRHAKKLNYEVECNWHEFSKPWVKIPQLNFYMPFSYECKTYKYDIPFGIIRRPDANDDRPANNFVLGVNENAGEKSVMVIANTKYGFRTLDNSIALTLLRSSYQPDLYPEIGFHKMRFAVGVADGGSNPQLIEEAFAQCHPFHAISVKPSKGDMPMEYSFISCQSHGTGAVSCVKMPEDGAQNSIILRLYETEGKQSVASFLCFRPIKNVYYMDLNENVVEKAPAQRDTINVQLSPYCVSTVRVEFED